MKIVDEFIGKNDKPNGFHGSIDPLTKIILLALGLEPPYIILVLFTALFNAFKLNLRQNNFKYKIFVISY